MDAVDNGVNITRKGQEEPVYTINTGLSARVSRENPPWFENTPDQSASFKKAMDIAEEEFISVLYSIFMVSRPAY